jgi:hypothetical protein
MLQVLYLRYLIQKLPGFSAFPVPIEQFYCDFLLVLAVLSQIDFGHVALP